MSKKPVPPENKAMPGPPENKAPADVEAPIVPSADTPEPTPAASPTVKPRTFGFLRPKE